MSILFEQLLEALDLDEALNESIDSDIIEIDVDFLIEPSDSVDDIKQSLKSNFNIDLVEYDNSGYGKATLCGSKQDLIKYLTSAKYGDNDVEWVEEYYPELLESCDKELKEDISTTPGKDKAFNLINEFDNSRDMLEELIRYLPENTVKEFIDYYAENFMGIGDDWE